MTQNKHNRTSQSHHHNVIRNLGAFLKSYVQSDSFKRSLARPASYTEHTVRDKKGEYTYRDNFKGNQLAIALHNAVVTG